jgi:hypothetical protein
VNRDQHRESKNYYFANSSNLDQNIQDVRVNSSIFMFDVIQLYPQHTCVSWDCSLLYSTSTGVLVDFKSLTWELSNLHSADSVDRQTGLLFTLFEEPPPLCLDLHLGQ